MTSISRRQPVGAQSSPLQVLAGDWQRRGSKSPVAPHPTMQARCQIPDCQALSFVLLRMPGRSVAVCWKHYRAVEDISARPRPS